VPLGPTCGVRDGHDLLPELLILATVQGPVWGWSDERSVVLVGAALAAIAMTVA